jgi:hypothetical protein
MTSQTQTQTRAQPPAPSRLKLPRCSKCGGRLFLENDYQGWRLSYYLGCLSCGEQFRLDGEKLAHTGAVPVKREVYNMRKLVGIA